VHGLNGHPVETWTKTEDGITAQGVPKQEPTTHPSTPEGPPDLQKTLWLKDLLPQQRQPINLDSLPNIAPQVRASLELTTGLQGARIRSFGYDSTLPLTGPNSGDENGGQSAVTLEKDLIGSVARELLTAIGANGGAGKDPDKTPLVFVAHDLGGLIVKEVRLGSGHVTVTNITVTRRYGLLTGSDCIGTLDRKYFGGVHKCGSSHSSRCM